MPYKKTEPKDDMTKKSNLLLKEKDKEIVDHILEKLEHFKEQSQEIRNTWGECYDAYTATIDNDDNPYVSNLFLPKTHSGVELLTAFLAGKTQVVRAKPAGPGDAKKALPIQRLLSYQWQKVLRARDKVVTWVKQSVLFGTAFMKVGWIDEKDKKYDDPFIEVADVNEIYLDYFIKDIQEQECVIHEIKTTKERIKNNALYKTSENIELLEQQVIDNPNFDDNSNYNENNVILYEYWSKDKIYAIAQGPQGYVLLRNEENPYGFIPFVKLIYKTSPLNNRVYGIGAVEPSLNIQDAYNKVVNQMFDNITLVNNPMWVVRRGANVNPQDLVAKGGGMITVSDVNADVRQFPPQDIKQSIELLRNLLDNEFQQASGAINLLRSMGDSGTATEAALEQQNAMSAITIVQENIREALSELGQMLVKVNQENMTTNKTIKLMEMGDSDIWKEVTPDEIDGKFDVDIDVDTTTTANRYLMAKYLLQFLGIVSQNPEAIQKYDLIKLYDKWMEFIGMNDVDELKRQALPMMNQPQAGGGQMPIANQQPENVGPLAETMGVNQETVGANQPPNISI
jgi:hypothetical protein